MARYDRFCSASLSHTLGALLVLQAGKNAGHLMSQQQGDFCMATVRGILGTYAHGQMCLLGLKMRCETMVRICNLF